MRRNLHIKVFNKAKYQSRDTAVGVMARLRNGRPTLTYGIHTGTTDFFSFRRSDCLWGAQSLVQLVAEHKAKCSPPFIL